MHQSKNYLLGSIKLLDFAWSHAREAGIDSAKITLLTIEVGMSALFVSVV